MIRRPPRSTLFPSRRSSDLRKRRYARDHTHTLGRESAELAARGDPPGSAAADAQRIDRKSTRLNSSHLVISYAVFCLKKKKKTRRPSHPHKTQRSLEQLTDT